MNTAILRPSRGTVNMRKVDPAAIAMSYTTRILYLQGTLRGWSKASSVEATPMDLGSEQMRVEYNYGGPGKDYEPGQGQTDGATQALTIRRHWLGKSLLR